jgi:heme-degrading monooxygenase HmoA
MRHRYEKVVVEASRESGFSDPGRGPELRAYFRRLDALAAVNEDGTLDVYLLRPVADRDDERALIHSYLQTWVSMSGVSAELLE